MSRKLKNLPPTWAEGALALINKIDLLEPKKQKCCKTSSVGFAGRSGIPDFRRHRRGTRN